MYINRQIESLLKNSLESAKIIVLYGARQVGKTTLLNNLYPESTVGNITMLACDQQRIQDQLIPDALALQRLFGKSGLVIFDEMQTLTNPGLILKIIYDHLPHIRVIATGSASFDLANKISEPLTGRHLQFQLHPFSFSEIAQSIAPIDLPATMNDCLLYGTYPKIYNLITAEEKTKELSALADNYLYKDILTFDLIKNSHKVRELLIAVALQLGQEVSYHELGQRVKLNYKTIERYLDLLEKSFVLFRLRGFSRNLRNEISRKVKIYFYDCGIRNALINNFNTLVMRSDSGALFENYIISEMIKKNSLSASRANFYFWRTHTDGEIDLIQESGGHIKAFEFKLTKPARYTPPSAFTKAYPAATWQIVSLNDFETIRQLLI
ncbi:MAG: ATP-binding protein [Candidatus Magasanikbacteria bacterium]|nr:ATP-binding protein [Candidatus Magasanikbacteria bacterium]